MQGEYFAGITAENADSSQLPLYLPVLLCLTALFFDLATPRGVAAGVAYVGLVFCARGYSSARAPFLFAVIGTALTVLGYFGKGPSIAVTWMVIANRVLCVAVIWLVALLLFDERKKELKLRGARARSESLLKVLTSTDDAIIGKNLDGLIRFCNAGAARLFGYPPQSIVGKNISILIPEELREQEHRILTRLREGESIDGVETRRLRKDGSLVDVSLTIAPLRDELGVVEGAITVLRDITGRKQAEFALLQSEQRYALAIKGMSVGVWEWDLIENRLMVSQRFREILGLDDDSSPVSIGDFEGWLHPDDRPQFSRKLQQHLGRHFPFDMEFRICPPHGGLCWIHASGQAIWDEEGVPMRMVGSVDDISERKRSQERIRLIVQEAPYALLMANGEGVIQLVNRAAIELFGWSEAELVGGQVEMLIPERMRHLHPEHRARYFGAPSTIDPRARSMGQGKDLFGLRRDGSEFPLEVGFISLDVDEGKLVLCSMIDITERKQIEEQTRHFNEILECQVRERTEQLSAANRELEQFAFVASHDLKAPLRVIDNASKWLEEDLTEFLNDDTRESMKLLRGRVRRMEKLLDDLLEYSRVGRKFDASYSEWVRGDVLIQDILELLNVPEGFTIAVDPLFSAIEAPRMPLQQILHNLINNSIKHHHRQAGTIEVKVLEQGADYLFVVRDDGPGIAPRFHDDVFKMFQTLRPRDEVEGSGMGLALARKQVETFGGVLALESDQGKGCIFRFTLPRQPIKRSVSA